MLSRKEKENILSEITYYEVFVAFEKGIVVKEQDDYFVDEEENIFDREEVIKVVYNDEIKKRIAKFLKPLLRMRGVKDLENINKNDPEVKKVLKEMRLKNKQIGGDAKLSDEDESVAIQIVIDKHEPQYQAAAFQLIIWALIRDDLFTLTNKGIECRIEVDVPDEYWDVKEESNKLDEILLGSPLNPIQRKKSEPLERMIAITSQLVNKYEKFAERVGELAAVAFGNLAAMAQDYDDAAMFRRELVAILPNYLVRTDDNGNWIDVGGGVYFNSEKDRERQIKEPEEKAS